MLTRSSRRRVVPPCRSTEHLSFKSLRSTSGDGLRDRGGNPCPHHGMASKTIPCLHAALPSEAHAAERRRPTAATPEVALPPELWAHVGTFMESLDGVWALTATCRWSGQQQQDDCVNALHSGWALPARWHPPQPPSRGPQAEASKNAHAPHPGPHTRPDSTPRCSMAGWCNIARCRWWG